MELETYIIGTESIGLASHKESGTEGLLKIEASDVEHVLDTLKFKYDWGNYETGGAFSDKWYFPKDQVIVTIELLEDIVEL
jgi:hypothetical protein